jgi:hypothetical protein
MPQVKECTIGASILYSSEISTTTKRRMRAVGKTVFFYFCKMSDDVPVVEDMNSKLA